LQAGKIRGHLPAQVRQRAILPASLQEISSADRNFCKKEKSIFWIEQPISGKSFEHTL